MFNNKPYLEVNREERFYCALFGHALLSSKLVRERFAGLVESKFKIQLNPDTIEMFLEVAALRDYWNDLGDPVAYDEETHKKRRAVVASILKMMNIPETDMDDNHFFWTSNHHKKLWSPGRWEPQAIKESGLKELVKIRWAFNAKPDILVISGPVALIIEGKLESGEGRDEGSGYGQNATQDLIIKLLQLLVPQFQKMEIHKKMLALNPEDGISWNEVLNMVENSGLDDFTMRCFSQLKRYYPAK